LKIRCNVSVSPGRAPFGGRVLAFGDGLTAGGTICVPEAVVRPAVSDIVKRKRIRLSDDGPWERGRRKV